MEEVEDGELCVSGHLLEEIDETKHARDMRREVYRYKESETTARVVDAIACVLSRSTSSSSSFHSRRGATPNAGFVLQIGHHIER
jgi:hypothetical protein